ncbi:MAG: hypothetical protein REH83_03170 [Rickettsiella sp.]|nr:hypothetical protein [Rickettsiella sp.]
MKTLNYKLRLHSNLKNEEEISSISTLLKNKKIVSSTKKIKKIKSELRRKISRKRIQRFDKKLENRNVFFYKKPSSAEIQLKNNFSILLRFYINTDKTERLYENHIENVFNERVNRAYRFFYNRLSGKIQTYQLLVTDQGNNFEISSNKFTKIAVLFTYLFYFIPVPILNESSGGATRYGLKLASEKRKIKKTKNKLDRCITDPNFIKLLSILLTIIHQSDFTHQENIELFLENIFQNFWILFKKQAKAYPNKENLINFWSEFLVTYFNDLKCPLQKENFYENVKKMIKESQAIIHQKSSFNLLDKCALTIDMAHSNLPINSFSKDLDMVQQGFLILYFIQLIQTYSQTLAQQKTINSNCSEPLNEKKMMQNPLHLLGHSAGFWSTKLPTFQTNYAPLYTTTSSTIMIPCQ